MPDQKRNFWIYPLTSLAAIIAACAPFCLFGDPKYVAALPWSWIGVVREIFGILPYWEFDRGWWPLLYTLATLIVLVVTARWKWALVTATIWFLINVAIGYYAVWVLSHT